MRKIRLFIAMSLDGYLADAQGGVDWLNGQGDGEELLDSYGEFVKQVDTVVMGWNTYHQIVTELSPEEWVYGDLTSYVVTHRDCPSTEDIRFTREDPCCLVKRLQETEGKDIWICGGAKIIQQLVREDLIDEYYISVIPMLLGEGIRLFGESRRRIPLRLVKTQSYDGIMDLIYARRHMDKE
ncbi:MAG: dihydrofolate reductase [Lachnospiraceae bacterium]|jgi:dihydrofolate reductase|nr:dihydrofolate reductase [Lachnospiraceae bacterium]MCI8995020.1 dihydrofolate reductase [Lachnospiraceae bacterium]MCI9135339.1 dihydrofolate reductase [Lachnospiraceae bacterium]